MKRYAIVRVECPPKNEIDAQFVCFPKDNNCSGCRYGDTKEQLIRKVTQTRFKQKIEEWYEHFEEKPNKTIVNCLWERCLEQAKEIVEFLGVEE